MSMDIDQLVLAHLEVWSTPAAPARRGRIPEIYADDVQLFEPDAAVVGHNALDEAISALLRDLPVGSRFAVDGPISAHHNTAVYRWTVGPEGATFGAGTDVLHVDGGKVSAAYVFLRAPD